MSLDTPGGTIEHTPNIEKQFDPVQCLNDAITSIDLINCKLQIPGTNEQIIEDMVSAEFSLILNTIGFSEDSLNILSENISPDALKEIGIILSDIKTLYKELYMSRRVTTEDMILLTENISIKINEMLYIITNSSRQSENTI